MLRRDLIGSKARVKETQLLSSPRQSRIESQQTLESANPCLEVLQLGREQDIAIRRVVIRRIPANVIREARLLSARALLVDDHILRHGGPA
jgi:hypothetical protein